MVHVKAVHARSGRKMNRSQDSARARTERQPPNGNHRTATTERQTAHGKQRTANSARQTAHKQAQTAGRNSGETGSSTGRSGWVAPPRRGKFWLTPLTPSGGRRRMSHLLTMCPLGQPSKHTVAHTSTVFRECSFSGVQFFGSAVVRFCRRTAGTRKYRRRPVSCPIARFSKAG
jgi:hypothetical protein